MTLLEHVHEMRARLFWVIIALFATTSLGFFAQGPIMGFLMAPLGGQRLVYLTPIGGFNFIIKVSIFFGIGLILPVIIYQLYRFLEPIMSNRHRKSVAFYSVASFFLAILGGAFAYYGSLPAALHFLTGVKIQNVSAMVTVDSYLSFVITYILGFAALFQIPLVIMIINMIKPIPPKKLLGYERHVILGAFIVGAILSPSPDVTNQTIMAVPIIFMYQVGIFMVWLQNRSKRGSDNKIQAALTNLEIHTQPVIRRPAVIRSAAAQKPATLLQTKPTVVSTPIQQDRPTRTSPIMDVGVNRSVAAQRTVRPTAVQPTLRQQPLRPAERIARPLPTRRPSIDGIVPRTQQLPQAG